jgi:hypothetical protein
MIAGQVSHMVNGCGMSRHNSSAASPPRTATQCSRITRTSQLTIAKGEKKWNQTT